MCEGAKTLEPPHLNATPSGIKFTNAIQSLVLKILGILDSNNNVLDYELFASICDSFRSSFTSVSPERTGIIISFSEEEMSGLLDNLLRFSTFDEFSNYIQRNSQGDEKKDSRYRTLGEIFFDIRTNLVSSFSK